jgi:O-antigen biosynthesis protein
VTLLERTISVPAASAPPIAVRPHVAGKFLYAGDEKLWVRGVTYGAFKADPDGREYTDVAQLERDFAAMAASGLNAVRIPHTTPPRHLLDVAQRHGLRVMVGLSAEQFVGYLADSKRGPDVLAEVKRRVREVSGHPALLCYALGNEIQAPVARWIGRRRVERYLESLAEVVREEDPGGLLTYVNYPSTEYLDLPFLDFLSFNVYLESQDRYEAYLTRLQNVAGDRPLLMSEIGLDSMRNGLDAQARSVEWQIRSSFAAGCTGAFVFAWTDEWYRGKDRVEDWAFGLTDAERRPKPALAAAHRAFAEAPFPADMDWPRVSVVVCTYNGARTLADCLDGVRRLDYADYELIVVDDGSTDASATIAAEFEARIISTPNRGLSSARNTGAQAASGEIVAYLDDDARPDQHWLRYLAAAYRDPAVVAAGGPNIPPPEDGPTAQAVANSPGGPLHVLISDSEADHLPGCNLSIRRDALLAIGGFDPQFTSAGDDVDICWRLRDAGGRLAFHAGAMVWHHRRGTVRGYLKQQRGYGRAEALLERKWPGRFNRLGHLDWAGTIYGRGLPRPLLGTRARVYGGSWGTAPFQRLYEEQRPGAWMLPLTPDWYLLAPLLLAVSLIGLAWPPAALFALPLILIVLLPVLAAARSAARATLVTSSGTVRPGRLRGLVFLLHLLQPLARLRGRLALGLAPWRMPSGTGRWTVPRRVEGRHWTPAGRDATSRLTALRTALDVRRVGVRAGGPYDRWDLELRAGATSAMRLLLAIEEQGGGAQFVRYAMWPVVNPLLVGLSLGLTTLAILAALDNAWLATAAFAVIAALLLGRMLYESGRLAAIAVPLAREELESA